MSMYFEGKYQANTGTEHAKFYFRITLDDTVISFAISLAHYNPPNTATRTITIKEYSNETTFNTIEDDEDIRIDTGGNRTVLLAGPIKLNRLKIEMVALYDQVPDNNPSISVNTMSQTAKCSYRVLDD